MTQTFRIFGNELERDEVYLDCDLVEITDRGLIELSHDPKDEVWHYSTTELNELRGDGLLYALADIDKAAPIWKAIDEVIAARDKSTVEDTSHFDEAAETLFRNAA